MDDGRSRRALRNDPEAALLVFELHAGAIGDETGERETRNVRPDRGVRAARGTAVGPPPHQGPLPLDPVPDQGPLPLT
jgi:hypothetical protein